MFKGLFSQLVIIAIAVGIILTYIKPTLAEIGTTQDDTAIYREERKKVAFVNQQLAKLMSEISQVPQADRQALETYLPSPDNVDVIGVPRDLEFITESVGATFLRANLASVADAAYKPEDDRLVPYAFNFSFDGTYDEVKGVLSLMEQNNYPLEIHSMDVTTEDMGDTLQVDALLVTYAYQPATE